ncbi:tripartite motif-containing 16-like protein [Labeo rohita]|uniref:Tripartite motif-containing 16-like protein n=1 Tax=Labeo rohita TaxID=84645 RepID=A0A498MQ90_LABRO|nr:tripartite motif-containing 16-like protein [Labeo rohita]
MSATFEVPFVSCDLCVEVKTPALKTCLKCEVSMCAQHLQTHLTTPVLLQTHPLTNPVQSGSSSQMASKCSAHGKLVEYYCMDDCVLVCMSCAIEEGHRLHNMKTLQTAHTELSGQLREELKALAQRQNQAKELERWHKNQMQILENCVSQLMKSGSALKELALTNSQTSLSARLGALQTAQQAVSSVLKEEDHFNFLQKFASVHKAITEARKVNLKLGLGPGPDRTKIMEDIRKVRQVIEKQVHKFQRKFFAFADPQSYSVVQDDPNSVSELTFDPQTLGPEMTLSNDLKMLFYTRSSFQGYRGSYTAQTLRLQTKQTGNMRWSLNLSEHCDWTIGLCNTKAMNGNYSEVYGLKKQNKSLLSVKTEDANRTSDNRRSVPIIQTSEFSYEFHVTGPWKVEVIWDDTSNLLAFYSRNKPTKGFLLCKLKAKMLCPFITFENISSNLQKENRGQHQTGQRYVSSVSNSYTELLCVLK